MRVTLSLVSAAALAAGTIALSATPASAIKCPPGTRLQKVVVAGQERNVCVPDYHCDPVSCDVILP